MSRLRSFLLRLAAYLAAFMVGGLAYWLHDTFGPLTVDQVFWHLRYADGPAMVMSSVFFVECAVDVVLVPLGVALLAAWAHGAFARQEPGWRPALRALPAVLGLAALCTLALQVSAFSYVAAYYGPDRFAQEYQDPRGVELVQERRRNLVLIYAESLEAGYGDRHLFGHDLLAPLHRLGGQSYAHYRPVPGATWTMAAMVATQCGVPLKVYAQVDIRRTDKGKAFLPGATCLGDVLQAHGYRNVFLGGVPLSFAGKGAFLRDHGYDETWGREEWERAGATKDEFNIWGMYDAPLFARARARLDQLHAAGQPFNLTLLTLDTHNPFGFRSQECARSGTRDFEGIVSCSAAEIADLVNYARSRGYLKDTAFVVVGDHLAVPNPAYDKLVQQGSGRGMFNLFVGDALPARNTNELLPFDMFPTLVEVAGIRVTGDRLGLGYSAVEHEDAVRPQDREGEWAQAALRPSPRYSRLWEEDAAGVGAAAD